MFSKTVRIKTRIVYIFAGMKGKCTVRDSSVATGDLAANYCSENNVNTFASVAFILMSITTTLYGNTKTGFSFGRFLFCKTTYAL